MDIHIFKKIAGPILLILAPIWLILIIPAGLELKGTLEEPTIREWVWVIGFGIAGIILGLIFCEHEYGLVTRLLKKKKN